MTISGVTSSNFSVSQLTGMRSMSQTSSTSDSDKVGHRPPPGEGPGGGGFLDAITEALSQLGVTDQSGTSSTSADDTSDSTTQDPAQALASFMQNLMQALHSQNANSTDQTEDSTGNGDNPDQGTSGVQGGGRPPHGGPGRLEADLQSLIQKLSASASDSSSSTSDSDDTTSASSTSDTAESALEQSFSNLMKALGNTNSDATLNKFLQAFQSNMQNVHPAGNMVNTKV